MERFIHRVQLIEAVQFEPALLPWPEGIRLREGNRFQLCWPNPRARPEPIYPGDYIVFRGGVRFAVYRRREFEAKFAKVEVQEPAVP